MIFSFRECTVIIIAAVHCGAYALLLLYILSHLPIKSQDKNNEMNKKSKRGVKKPVLSFLTPRRE